MNVNNYSKKTQTVQIYLTETTNLAGASFDLGLSGNYDVEIAQITFHTTVVANYDSELVLQSSKFINLNSQSGLIQSRYPCIIIETGRTTASVGAGGAIEGSFLRWQYPNITFNNFLDIYVSGVNSNITNYKIIIYMNITPC